MGVDGVDGGVRNSHVHKGRPRLAHQPTPTYITSHNANANANEQEVIKQGDLLLNRLSKLARIVDF